MSNTTVSTSSHPLQHLIDDQFAMTVRQAAEIMSRPEYNGRLDRAVELVLSGAVTLHDDGTATVKSGNRTYEILDECTCQDSQNCSKYCKHYLAVLLLKRTYERMGGSNGNRHHTLHAQPNVPQSAS